MPRPNRAYGRPGSEVIPHDWSSSHAPVVEATLTGSCRVLPPTDPTDLVAAADLTVSAAAGEATHTGPFRLQQQNAQAAVAMLGDQFQTTAAYLIVLRADAEIPYGAGVVIDTCPEDPTAVGRRFTVRKVARGSQRFERDLWCVDDLTSTT